jgi:hypothetical protein
MLMLAFATGGCATIARGTGEQVAFDTVPSGAEVRATVQDNRASEGSTDPGASTMGCITPCVLQVKRVEKMAVTVTKQGFETEAFSLVPQASGEGVATSVAGNLLLAGGVVGLVVDGASGAGLDKCPNPVRIALRPQPQAQRRGQAPGASARSGYDPVAACKEQTSAKYAPADQQRAAQADAR